MRPERQDRDRNRERDPRRKGGGGGGSGNGGSGSGGGAASGGGSGRNRKRRKRSKPKEDETPVWVEKPKNRRYAVEFFGTFAEARSKSEELATKKQEVDQLNVVILEDGNMDDPDLSRYGKIFAGAAWTLIHQRRVEDGWYDSLQE